MPLVLEVLLIIVAVLLFIGYLVIDNMSDEMYDEISKIFKKKKGKNMKLKDLQKGNVFYTKKGNYFVVGKAEGIKTATNLKTGKVWVLDVSFEDDDLVMVWDGLVGYSLTGLKWERKDILTDDEKDYLNKVIKPFKDRVDYIKKIESPSEKYHSILIAVDSIQNNGSQAYINLPLFVAGSMYKDMVVDVKYNLKDLGL